MSVDRVSSEIYAGEDIVANPGAEMTVDEFQKGIGTKGNSRLPWDRSTKINRALGQGVNGVGEGVADSDG